MAMDSEMIQRTRQELEQQLEHHLQVIEDSPVIKVLNLIVQTNTMNAANAKLKTKQQFLLPKSQKMF